MECNEDVYRSDEGEVAGDGRTNDGGGYTCDILEEECRLQQRQSSL